VPAADPRPGRRDGLTVTDGPTLVPYDGSCAARVVDWCAASPFSSEWVPTGAADADAVLAGWQTDPDITGYLLLRDGHPVAYGELWVEADEDEAELAHLVVDPALRRQGLGRALALELVGSARALGLANVFLRVRPDNDVGISCYESAGFVRCSAEEEASFNSGQPAAYQWMRWPHRG
jgi:ribosomal protein S18 acetylase RimI-like enzyme